ncbi:MAG: hypothetical protein HOP29_11290 [Phycisphaerales bacterium]|nr:hypothetical protein [Phycisphaerales bacterium]
MEYRCVATSVEGFVQQLAVAYITHGYWFYVAGEIPEGKDLAVVDAKLIKRYGIAISKWARCRRKKQGLANMQYLRHGRFFVLLATKGRHAFFERERASFRDVRRVPIKFAGYSIGCRTGRDGQWHASVRIDPGTYADLKAFIVEAGIGSSVENLTNHFVRTRLQPYAPVRGQLLSVWRTLNRARRTAGLEGFPVECVPSQRRLLQPFRPFAGRLDTLATTDGIAGAP